MMVPGKAMPAAAQAADLWANVVYPTVVDPQPQAITIYCSDPRCQGAFEQLIEDALALPKGSYLPFVVAGGAGPLARPELLPKEFKFIRDRLELYRSHFHSLQRVILINHEDCAYYKDLPQRLFAVDSHIHLPLDDMRLIAQVFGRLLSHLRLQLEMYYARFVDPSQEQLRFEKVT